MSTEIRQVKAKRQGPVRARPNRLGEQELCIAVFDVESLKHGVFEDVEGDSCTVPGEVAMVGKGVETWTGPSGWILDKSRPIPVVSMRMALTVVGPWCYPFLGLPF